MGRRASPFHVSRARGGLAAALCALCWASLAFAGEIRYAVIGDSYSNGEGATPEQAWPALLARHLREAGLPVDLVANPSKTGWTTSQALELELPVFQRARPDFATLQIGVNDWVQRVSAAEFRKNVSLLLDGMLAVLPDRKRLLVVTIPDFSVTPAARSYRFLGDIALGISGFNRILEEEASARRLKVVDVFPASQKMGDEAALVAADGLHPSAAEYAVWEGVVFPVARDVLAR